MRPLELADLEDAIRAWLDDDPDVQAQLGTDLRVWEAVIEAMAVAAAKVFDAQVVGREQ